MAQALSVSRVVNIQVNMGPIAAARADFGTLNIFGDSAVIDPIERSRIYTSIEGVAADFGLNAPEYEAATHYFGQIPSPRVLMVSCWNAVASPALLKGAILTENEQNMLRWRNVTNGSFKLGLTNGSVFNEYSATNLDFSTQTNLNGVAEIMTTALSMPGPFPAVLVGGTMREEEQENFLEISKFAPVKWSVTVNNSAVELLLDLTDCETMDDVATKIKEADTDNVFLSVKFFRRRLMFTTTAVGGSAAISYVSGLDAHSDNLVQIAKLTADNAESLTQGSTANRKDILVTWTGERFVFTSAEIGSGMAFDYVTPGLSTDISKMLKATAETASGVANGFDAETPAEAVYAAYDLSGNWYACMFAAEHEITTAEYLKVSGLIEASGRARIFGVTTTDTRVLDLAYMQDFPSQAKKARYNRTISQYSAKNPYAVASLFGRMLTVNFSGSMTTITLKFKQQPGITYEELTESQAAALEAKNCNVFAFYNNDTAILQEGVVASGAFIDEIHNLDWLANAIQTELYNVLYTSTTKIPQTEDGIAILKAVVKGVCEEGVRNGMIGENLTWTTNGFGALQYGDVLPFGYYVYTTPLVLQPQSERERRKAPTIQVACKLSGAIHSINGIINVSR